MISKDEISNAASQPKSFDAESEFLFCLHLIDYYLQKFQENSILQILSSIKLKIPMKFREKKNLGKSSQIP